MPISIEKWDFFEHSHSYEGSTNPFMDVTLEATFTHHDRQVNVYGFYDGGSMFKLRFMPDREGIWNYITHSNVAALNGRTGSFNCTPASASNHGPVHVADTTRFAYEDGTPYIPIGTTCYVWNLQGDVLEEQTLRTLDNTPFNKIRMCVFPKHYLYNNNEPPCHPFPQADTNTLNINLENKTQRVEPSQRWDFNRFNPEYFQHLEKRILDLRSRGIEADLILFHPYDNGKWGFDCMPADVNERYLRYVAGRLSAFRNVWWSFANEYDLMKGRTMADWDHYFQVVQNLDPYNHLRSIHNCGSFYDHNKPWVTHCSIQHQSVNRVSQWLRKYNKPVVIDECGYEGNISMVWGDLSPEEMVLRFWLGFVQGGYVGHGETYVNNDEVLWWSRGGQLHGESVPRIDFLHSIFNRAPALTPLEKVDMEFLNLMDPELTTHVFGTNDGGEKVIAEGGWNHEAGGYNLADGYYLFYFGMRQPSLRNFNLLDGTYRIDVIDTWNMTLETVTENASGQTCVNLPSRKYMAIRIQKIPSEITPDVNDVVLKE